MDHVRYMLWTTGPAALISIILYGVIGLQTEASAFDCPQVLELVGHLEGMLKSTRWW